MGANVTILLQRVHYLCTPVSNNVTLIVLMRIRDQENLTWKAITYTLLVYDGLVFDYADRVCVKLKAEGSRCHVQKSLFNNSYGGD